MEVRMLKQVSPEPEEVRKFELQIRLAFFRTKLETARLEKFNFEEAYKTFREKVKKKTEAMKAIEDWMRTDKRILILSSLPGAGKTFATAFWLYHLWKKAWLKNYTKLTFFFVQEKELFGPAVLPKEEREEAIQDARNAAFLVIDDFGQVKPRTEAEEESMRVYYEDLIDWRRKLSQKKFHGILPRMIITTNLTLQEFKALPYLSDRFWSRMRAISSFKRIEDEDYRSYGFPDFIPSRVKISRV
jgi:DNA replication protein DnaC